MSMQKILQQLLQAGQQQVNSGTGNQIKDKVSKASQSINAGGLGTGLLAGGALALLLGNKKFRKMGGTVAKYGGIAAVGAMAYKAYEQWQQNQTNPTTEAPEAAVAALPEPQQNQVILSAMIAAAKADGHIDETERKLIEHELARLNQGGEDTTWYQNELNKPADPSAIAALAPNLEVAAEIYLATLLVIDEQNFMEKAYLDELAKQLNLPVDLKNSLHSDLENA